MTSANEERGEFDIELGGGEYVMRPSFEAIEAFETALGRSLIQLAADADGQALTLRQCAVIVTECVKAWGKAEGNTSARGFQVDVVAPLVMSKGVYLVQPKLAVMLFMAATGGLEPSGKAKSRPMENPIPAGDDSAGSRAARSRGSRKTSGRQPQ